MKVIIAYGTRPEAIKLAPIVSELRKRGVSLVLINTGQHREILDEVEDLFNLRPDYKLAVMQHNQTLTSLLISILYEIDPLLEKINPDLVLIQGDTTTVMAIGIACFHRKIKVAHVEAGLRSGSLNEPFPEEFNRKIVSLASRVHFSPTKRAKENLIAEGISADTIFVTGNTIVDAVLSIKEEVAVVPKQPRKTILVTAHRRENHGDGIRQICYAVNLLARENSSFYFHWPVHPNPNVKTIVMESLENRKNINLLPPLSYEKSIHLQRNADLIWTDSGGIQEEAAALKKPVLILRDRTERQEVVEAGFGIITGANAHNLISETRRILDNPVLYRSMISGTNPFGNGTSAQIICDLILKTCNAHSSNR